MFTRYSDIDVPKNYSGNRFKKSSFEDTTMKTHESEMQSATNTSVSPTFNERYNHIDYQTNKFQIQNKANDVNNEIYRNVNEQDYFATSNDNNNILEEKQVSCRFNDSNKDSATGFGSIIDYLKDIKSDDLLIILIIILLASDKSTSNNDIIILLALLLTSKWVCIFYITCLNILSW